MRPNPPLVALALAAGVLAAPAARAQFEEEEEESDSVDMGVDMSGTGMPGMKIRIDVNEGRGRKPAAVQVQAKARRREEITSSKPGETYKVVYEESSNGKTGFKFLEPERFHVTVKSSWQKFEGEIPWGESDLKGGEFYRVEVVDRSDRPVLSRNFEAKEGMIATFWVGASPAPANVNVSFTAQPPAPAAAPPPKPSCMGAGDFAAIKEGIEGESFSEQKVGVLESAISDRWVCVAQVVELLELYSFSADKLAALKLMKPAISDPQNRFKIYSALTFSSDKEEAKKILETR